jgi:hypothetical protein
VAILADALVTRGSALANLGRVREGLGVIEIGERLARESGYTHTLLRALNNRAINGYQFDPARALAAAAEGLTLARRVGDRGSASLYINGVAFGHVQRGEWDEALAVAASMATEDLAPNDRGNVIQQPFYVHAFRGDDLAPAMAEIDQILPALNEQQRRSGTLDIAAAVAWTQGRLVEARAAWLALVDLEPGEAKWALPLAARCAFWLGDGRAAEADLTALDATGLHSTLVELHRRSIRAGLAALEDPHGPALAMYRSVLKDWQDLGLAWEAALVGIDMATVLDPADPEVKAAIESSREILTRVGARPFLERLEAAASRSSGAQVPGRAGVAVVDRHAGVGQPLADEVGG